MAKDKLKDIEFIRDRKEQKMQDKMNEMKELGAEVRENAEKSGKILYKLMFAFAVPIFLMGLGQIWFLLLQAS